MSHAIIIKLLTCVCGNHDAAKRNSVPCSSLLNVEMTFHFLAMNGSSALNEPIFDH